MSFLEDLGNLVKQVWKKILVYNFNLMHNYKVIGIYPYHGKLGHLNHKTHIGHKNGKIPMVESPSTLNIFNNIHSTNLSIILHPNLHNLSNHNSSID